MCVCVELGFMALGFEVQGFPALLEGSRDFVVEAGRR